MDAAHLENLARIASGVLGDWWKDDRRNWCAYCGIPMLRSNEAGGRQPPTRATRDHVVPKAHRGGRLTIPACRECNASKGAMSLGEFLLGVHFAEKRRCKHRNQWPVADLWAVSAIASLKIAMSLAKEPVAAGVIDRLIAK